MTPHVFTQRITPNFQVRAAEKSNDSCLCFVSRRRLFRFHSTERGSGAARRAMGFLTRWLAGKMEDPAKRQADFEKHMTTTMAKCEEV